MAGQNAGADVTKAFGDILDGATDKECERIYEEL